jgi:hypothetical protein
LMIQTVSIVLVADKPIGSVQSDVFDLAMKFAERVLGEVKLEMHVRPVHNGLRDNHQLVIDVHRPDEVEE